MMKKSVNQFIIKHISLIEIISVLMRIFSFTIISWMGANSPFLFIWTVNTVDAIMLSWTAVLKKDKAYTILNIFWIGVGLMGIFRTLKLL